MDAHLGGLPAQAAALAAVGLNGWGVVERVRATPAGLPYRAVIAQLRARGARYGYADFWQALPLTFLSRGALQVASTATDARGFYDRTTHITQRVDAASDVFYVFNMEVPTQRPFAEALEDLARRAQVQYERADIPPLRIYTHLSRPVRPQELAGAG